MLFPNACFAAVMIFVADKVSTVLSDSTGVVVWFAAAVALSLANFGLLFWNILGRRKEAVPHPREEVLVPRPPKEAHSIDADVARHREAFEREMSDDAPPVKRSLPPIEVLMPEMKIREEPKPKMPTLQELKNIRLTEEEEPTQEQKINYDDPYYSGGY
jgi:hypothetical protein